MLLKNIDLFWNSWKDPTPSVWVILPDHFHVIVEVGEADISEVIHNFKITYSRHFRDHYRAGRVWQNRFWDHYIRDELDYQRHVNYIHFNPTKHGLTDDAFKYEHSSIKEFCDEDDCTLDWNLAKDVKSAVFGE